MPHTARITIAMIAAAMASDLLLVLGTSLKSLLLAADALRAALFAFLFFFVMSVLSEGLL